MITRAASMFVLTILCLVAAGCPAGGGDDETQAPPESAQQQPEQRTIVVKANPVSTLEKYVNAMNEGDHAAYMLLVHPESPDFEALIARFEQFERETARLSLEDATLQSEDDGTAVIVYDMTTEYTDPAVKPGFETGKAKLQIQGDQWLIWVMKAD